MLFSRKKEQVKAAAAENAAYFAEALKDAQQELAEIEKMPDIGEKYLTLVTLQEKVQDIVADVNAKATKQVKELVTDPLDKKGGKATFGILGTGIALVSAGVIFPPVMIAGMVVAACSLIAIPVTEKKKSKQLRQNPFTADKDSFCNSMEELLEKITHQRDFIFKNDLPALFSARNIEAICDAVPEVQTAFTKAAIKEGVFSPPVQLIKQPPAPPRQK